MFNFLDDFDCLRMIILIIELFISKFFDFLIIRVISEEYNECLFGYILLI